MPRLPSSFVNLSGLGASCVVGGDGDYGDGFDVNGEPCDTVVSLPANPVLIVPSGPTQAGKSTLDFTAFFNAMGFGTKTPAGAGAGTGAGGKGAAPQANLMSLVMVGGALLIVVALIKRNQ
jgi:hypothetical protein